MNRGRAYAVTPQPPRVTERAAPHLYAFPTPLQPPSLGEWLAENQETVASDPPRWLAVDPRTGSIVLEDTDVSRFESQAVTWQQEHAPARLWTLFTGTVLAP